MLLDKALHEIVLNSETKIQQKYIIMISKGKLMLFVQIQKALYSLIYSVIIFYRNLMKTLRHIHLRITHKTRVCQKRRSTINILW